MIGYDAERKLFFLHGKTYTYALWVNPSGYVQNLHFGDRIGEDDLRYFDGGSRPVSFSPIPPDAHLPFFSLDTVCNEYGSYGQGDFRAPSVVICRENGERASRFQYVSHEISGAATPEGLPHARGGQTLTLTLRDALSDAYALLHYTVFDDSDVLVRYAEIVNRGKNPIVLSKAYSFCLDLTGCEGYEALRLHGRHTMERVPERTKLGHGSLRIESSRGASSHQMNPFLAILSPRAGEESGECYGFQLIYSGSFALEAELSQTDLLRVQGGINELNFSWELGEGEKFTTPQVAICRTEGGLGQLSREYADFLRGRVLPPEWAFARRPIVVNNWEATYFDFDKEKLCALADEAAKLGIDALVLDDGWFGKRDGDSSGLGDWFVNERKLEGGLAPVIRHCREAGLKFGLWFEPEMISEDSDLFRAHPDWAIGKPPRCLSRNQLVLDMSRPEIVDYIFGRMSAILSEYGIDYVKWDMNRHITEFWSPKLPASRQGEFQHRYILGVYSLAERLRKAFPHVLFEGCSGGGGRFDAGMLYYFPQFWTSDDTDAFERAKIQWGTSYCYPLSAMSCHVSACPNHQTGRTTPFSSRAAIASLGAFGYELSLGALTEEEKTQVRAQIADYRRTEELILKGDLYRILDPHEGNYFCAAAVAKDKTGAYVVGMQIHANPGDFDRRVRLSGLAPEKRYLVEELQITARGDTLMHAGLLLPRLLDFGCWTWHLREV